MKMREIRDLSLDQIEDYIRDLAKKRMNMRFEQAVGQIKNTSALGAMRHDIARLKTERRRRSLIPSSGKGD